MNKLRTISLPALLASLPPSAWAGHANFQGEGLLGLFDGFVVLALLAGLGLLALVVGLGVAIGKGRAQRRHQPAASGAPPTPEPSDSEPTPEPVSAPGLLAEGLAWGIAAIIAVLAAVITYTAVA